MIQGTLDLEAHPSKVEALTGDQLWFLEVDDPPQVLEHREDQSSMLSKLSG